jgi:hypothetical protein
MATQSTRPENRREFMNKLVVPYDPKYGNPNQIFSEPYKAGQPENDRSLEISLKNDDDKDFSVGIKDINEAVNYYFTNVLKLSVVQNNTKVLVPVIYGSAENWKSVQSDGYYRDANSKLMAPLIMFKRNSLTQNRGLGNKLDGNHVKNTQVFEKTFNKRNAYSNFKVLNNRVPQKEYVVVATPDYVTLQYSCIIWTNFIEQMDKLIESLNYASRSYWGDPNKFQFYSAIDSFEDATSFSTGEDRLIRSNFTLTLNGWLIPDTMNKTLSVANRVYGASQIIFGLETANSLETFEATQNKQQSKKLTNIITSDSQNIVINQTTGGTLDPATLVYLNTTKQLTGTFVNSTTCTFAAGFLLAPAGLPTTSVDNFTFFCNGQLIEKTAISSFTHSAGTSTLVIITANLGFQFDAADEIIAIGKFS